MLIFLPGLNGEESMAVTPRQVTFNCLLLLIMGFVVRVFEGKLLEFRELALNSVEPRAVSRSQVNADVMALGPCQDGVSNVGAVIVHDHMEGLRARVARADPPQEGQKILGFLVLGEAAVEAVGFQIIVGQEVTDPLMAVIGRTQALQAFARPLAAMAMAW